VGFEADPALGVLFGVAWTGVLGVADVEDTTGVVATMENNEDQ